MTWEDRTQRQLVRKRGLGTECPGGAEAAQHSWQEASLEQKAGGSHKEGPCCGLGCGVEIWCWERSVVPGDGNGLSGGCLIRVQGAWEERGWRPIKGVSPQFG